jgi:uncharacterized protein (DUF952 family)
MAGKASLARTCIVHMAWTEAWEAAQRTGAYAPEMLHRDGYIHCSTPAQLLGVANHVANPFVGR